MNRIKKRNVTITVLSIFITSVITIRAQTMTSGIAQKINLSDKNITDGSIICMEKKGFGLCDLEYSPSMYGVVSDNPAAFLDTGANNNARMVLSEGVTLVRVSDKNGSVKKGDYVTSSSTPGMAVKANANGYVLGLAIEDAKQITSGGKVVTVALHIHAEASLSSTRSNLVSVLRDATKAPLLEPLAAFRYVLAGLLVVVSFTLGFVYFGKISGTVVEAIGRNPLAEKLIRRNLFLHVGLTIVIVALGLFASYLVLIL
jgi:F0F1-type ATP synthase membrane subunit c/vacuolar-type H+-ATPase subunit K